MTKTKINKKIAIDILHEAIRIVMNDIYYVCPAIKASVTRIGEKRNFEFLDFYVYEGFLMDLFVKHFKPKHRLTSGIWWRNGDVETRVLALLLLIEIAKDQKG
jgi:hypothetical protein